MGGHVRMRDATPRPTFHETELPARIEAIAKRLEKYEGAEFVNAGGWVVLHEPEMGRQRICMVVRTVHLPAK